MLRIALLGMRMILSRTRTNRVFSSWRPTKHEAYEHLKRRIGDSDLVLSDDPSLMRQKKAISQEPFAQAISQQSSVCNVQIVHQIYGLYRDGQEMSPLFRMSSFAWTAASLLIP